MDFADTFTVLRSSIATVQVEPPDLVTVEGLAVGTLRFSRSLLRTCRPMLVSYYREHFDPAFVAPDDGEIVVIFVVEGGHDGLLGPFPHALGIALAAAINTACGNLLFAVPEFSVYVGTDDARIWVNCRANGMRLSIPIPTARLAAFNARDDARIEARYTIPTGLAPTSPAKWIEVSFTDDQPYLLGPLSAADAATLTRAFHAWRAENKLDVESTDVSESDLVADPSRWHRRRIRVTAEWRYMFESSYFATAWLRPPADFRCAYGTYRARVVGTWTYPGSPSDRGYGHMGMWPGELEAESIELFEN